MSGNIKKLARNKPHGGGGVSTLVKIAVDIEEAALAGERINRRMKRDRQEARTAKKAAEAKRKITLPSFKFMDTDDTGTEQ